MSAPKKVRIGDLLVEQGAITLDQLEAGLAAQRDSGKKLGRVLIESGALSEDDLLKVCPNNWGYLLLVCGSSLSILTW